jgi:predicted DNA-binding transcriptional regulator AlpA
MPKTTNTHPDRPAELLQIGQVAQEYGFAEATLYDWRHRGIGPKSVRLGRRVYWRRSSIENWISEQEDKERAGRPA